MGYYTGQIFEIGHSVDRYTPAYASKCPTTRPYRVDESAVRAACGGVRRGVGTAQVVGGHGTVRRAIASSRRAVGSSRSTVSLRLARR